MNLLFKYPEIIYEMDLVEQELIRNTSSKQALVSNTTEELLKSGGKRLRPLLMILSAKIGEYNRDKIIPLATAIEILHMATLIHDDIIDEAHLRRGAQTIQSKWGKDIAVFTGDFLLCRAFLLMSKFNNGENTKKMARAIKIVCEGEIQQYHQRYRTDISIPGYLKRIAAKTAILFRVSSYIGAYESGCNRKLLSTLGSFGMNMGMAFQITDDVLDFTGENALMGKPVNNDYIQGIYTLPIIYALLNDDYSDEIKKHLLENQGLEKDDTRITQIAFESGGVAYAKKLAQKYTQKAQKDLDKLPESLSKEIMKDILDKLINRKV